MKKISLNIGCGETNLEGFINVDLFRDEVVKPDLICDVRKERLPYEDGSVSEIWMLHSLEHIELYYWEEIFKEFLRVLTINGTLVLSYPEFSECAKRFLSNYDNKKDFFRMTLYGRQLYDSDYHVVPMHSPDIKQMLEIIGFYRISFMPETEEGPYNTVLKALKDPEPITREAVITKELHL